MHADAIQGQYFNVDIITEPQYLCAGLVVINLISMTMMRLTYEARKLLRHPRLAFMKSGTCTPKYP